MDRLVTELAPRMQELAEKHGVDEAQAAAVLEETLEVLWYRWQHIARPEHWLLRALENRYRRLEAEA